MQKQLFPPQYASLPGGKITPGPIIEKIKPEKKVPGKIEKIEINFEKDRCRYKNWEVRAEGNVIVLDTGKSEKRFRFDEFENSKSLRLVQYGESIAVVGDNTRYVVLLGEGPRLSVDFKNPLGDFKRNMFKNPDIASDGKNIYIVDDGVWAIFKLNTSPIGHETLSLEKLKGMEKDIRNPVIAYHRGKLFLFAPGFKNIYCLDLRENRLYYRQVRIEGGDVKMTADDKFVYLKADGRLYLFNEKLELVGKGQIK